MVMTTARYIEKEALKPWLEGLAKDRCVMVPLKRDGATAFRPLGADGELDLAGLAKEPPKQAMLPRSETLLKYRYVKNGETPRKAKIQLEELLPTGSTLVFGARPCDVRGFTIYDRVYDAGKKRDVYYCTRREHTLIVSLACNEPAPTCFCHRVGGAPDDETGTDVLATDMGQGLLLEAVSDKGATFLRESDLADGADKAGEAAKIRWAVRQSMPEEPSFNEAPEHLRELFDASEFWEKQSAKCLSCGVCSYLCPTCYCFNITDEVQGDKGVRVRTWDNCMSFQFTLEGSGHNPRSVKAQRLRNRIGHKFNYYPELHEHTLACVGCGRCISNCPVSMDVRSILTAAMAQDTTGNATGKAEQNND